jgi:hypothetical protein
MGSHPLNLFIRFLLELTVLVSSGIWAWKQTESNWRYAIALLIPLILGSIWGVFAVPNDPSRSGSAPVVTPGFVRLALELGIFTWGTWILYNMGWHRFSLTFGILVVLHYLTSYDRIIWLITQK